MSPAEARYGPTLALTVTLAAAAFLILVSVVLLVSHPPSGLGAFTGLVDQQKQTAKTLLYVTTFVIILPLAVVFVPRLAEAIASGPNAAGVSVLAALLAGSLAAVLIVLRLSDHAPWGNGLGSVLVGVTLWSLAAGAVLRRTATARAWPSLLRAVPASAAAWIAAGVLAFGVIVGVTATGSLHPLPLVAGAALAAAVLTLAGRRSAPGSVGRVGWIIDAVAILALALAVPNLVVFHAGASLPNIYLPPGVIQNQQDYLLGSANQLLGGGALLVDVPVSQYGVGMIYLLDGWFHLVPIGYGTLGFLDGVLTALFYIAGYCVLRIAGVRRGLAVACLGVAVTGLIYGLHYSVGELPETGPLRFGLPMALVLARTCAVRWPARRGLAQAAGFVVIGIAAIWAFEAFVYTIVTFAAMLAAEAWYRRPGDRRRWLLGQLGMVLGAVALTHLLLAMITLAGSGSLPDWGQYFAYLRSFLLGGRAGLISYGFARWSPGLAFGAGAFVSVAALLLLGHRAPAAARREPVSVVTLAGVTAYLVALLSYIDNRSSTYLLPYVALPLVVAAGLWLGVLWRLRPGTADVVARAGLAFAMAVATLVVAAAWPSIGRNFSESALAHAYPGGGLGAAVNRLWHPPPIDPRAVGGERLLARYMPGRRALIILPTVPDLAVEILMRSHRTSSMFIADPIDDGFVPTVWLPKLRAQVARLRPGQRLLIGDDTLRVLADLRAHPGVDPIRDPLDYGDQEDEWLLAAIDRRFEIRPIHRAPDGLIVAELRVRR